MLPGLHFGGVEFHMQFFFLLLEKFFSLEGKAKNVVDCKGLSIACEINHLKKIPAGCLRLSVVT